MKQASKKPLISIIIPVYNVERYLAKCLDSIIAQDYDNFEVVLIDDGSIDGSSAICDDYSKKDYRIKVYHQKNMGVSAARNEGIRRSSGDYITYVDPDDTISRRFLDYLYSLNAENGTNIAVAPYIIVTERKTIDCSGIRHKDEKLSQKEALRRMLLDDGFTVSNGSKLIKRSLFDSIEYPKGKIFEDTATTYKLIMRCDSISYGHRGGYFYYKRGGSILNSVYDKKQLDFIYFTDEMGSVILNKYSDLRNEVSSKQIDSRFSILRRLVLIKKPTEEEKNAKKSIKKYILSRKRQIVTGPYNKKIKLATILLSAGEGVFRLFWYIYYKIKYRRAKEKNEEKAGS